MTLPRIVHGGEQSESTNPPDWRIVYPAGAGEVVVFAANELVRTLSPKVQPESSRENELETALYRVYKDLRAKRWFVEGIYD